MLSLQKTIEDRGLVDAYAQEIEAMKLQFNALKELYSELRLCCNTRTNVISDSDLDKRVETILAEYFDVPIAKKDLINAIRDAAVTVDGYHSGTGKLVSLKIVYIKYRDREHRMSSMRSNKITTRKRCMYL